MTFTIPATAIQQAGGLEKFKKRFENALRQNYEGGAKVGMPNRRTELPLKSKKIENRYQAKERNKIPPKKGISAKKLFPTEAEEQADVIRWATVQKIALPSLGLLFHVPNGGARHKATASRLKAEGVKAGVPDLCLPVPRGQYHGLWIEMKRQRGASVKVEPEQKWWIEQLQAQGYRAVICRGAEEAKQEILKYLRGVTT